MRSLLTFLAATVAAVGCATSPRAVPNDSPSPQVVADSAQPDTTQRDTTRPPPGVASDSPESNGGVASGSAEGGNGSAGTSKMPRPSPLSPRDSARIVVGGRELSVTYGRPSLRGRKVFGELVPFGRVWRTGANEATTFVTTADLDIGGVTVPAGTYTLYTVPAEPGGEWLLVINTQTGQWGTEYHSDRDLARVPLRARTLAAPVEQFTIALEPAGSDAATLSFAWENIATSVDVRVKGQ